MFRKWLGGQVFAVVGKDQGCIGSHIGQQVVGTCNEIFLLGTVDIIIAGAFDGLQGS